MTDSPVARGPHFFRQHGLEKSAGLTPTPCLPALDAPPFGLRPCRCLAQDLAIPATSELFASVSETPAVQSLARRLENGAVLACEGISQAAQPFLAALL